MPSLALKSSEDEIRDLLLYEPSTGQLRWLVSRGRVKAGDLAGSSGRNGRLYVGIGGRMYFAHRLAWLLTYGSWPDGDIDHIDGDPANNRISNLRDVSHQVNAQNRRRATKHSRSGLLGVSKVGRKWKAMVVHNGKPHYAGLFKTPELAHAAYLKAKRQLHAGCTI